MAVDIYIRSRYWERGDSGWPMGFHSDALKPLSSFYAHRIIVPRLGRFPKWIRGMPAAAVENAYQASKLAERENFPPWMLRNYLDSPEDILIGRPQYAKHFGARLPVTREWEENKWLRILIMDALVREKAKSEAYLRALCEVETIIEWNDWGDKFWGVDRELQVGANVLGQIHMRIRAGLPPLTAPKRAYQEPLWS